VRTTPDLSQAHIFDYRLPAHAGRDGTDRRLFRRPAHRGSTGGARSDSGRVLRLLRRAGEPCRVPGTAQDLERSPHRLRRSPRCSSRHRSALALDHPGRHVRGAGPSRASPGRSRAARRRLPCRARLAEGDHRHAAGRSVRRPRRGARCPREHQRDQNGGVRGGSLGRGEEHRPRAGHDLYARDRGRRYRARRVHGAGQPCRAAVVQIRNSGGRKQRSGRNRARRLPTHRRFRTQAPRSLPGGH
jgi:hypothetical protein